MPQAAIKRVTVNLPARLLADARAVTAGGITETIVEGLFAIVHRRAYAKALTLRGRLDLAIDVGASRERPRRRGATAPRSRALTAK